MILQPADQNKLEELGHGSHPHHPSELLLEESELPPNLARKGTAFTKTGGKKKPLEKIDHALPFPNRWRYYFQPEQSVCHEASPQGRALATLGTGHLDYVRCGQ